MAECRWAEEDRLDRTSEAGLGQEEAAVEEDLAAFRKQGVAVGDLPALAGTESTAGSWAKEKGRGEQEAEDAGALVGMGEEYPDEAGLVHETPLVAAAVACDHGRHTD